MTFKMKILFPIMSSLLFVVPSAAAEFTYQEYTKTPEVWKRGFVFGISQYMSAVAQPDEEAPYPVRTAYCAPWRVEPATLLRELTEGLEGLTAL